MSQTKASLLDERIAQFFESSTELLSNIHARNKAGTTGKSPKKRRMGKTIVIPDPDIDSIDEEPSGI